MRENAGYNPTRFQIGAIQVLGFVGHPESMLGLPGHPASKGRTGACPDVEGKNTSDNFFLSPISRFTIKQ